jgi:hypothetical protein
MMNDNEPNLVTSGKSRTIDIDGYPFSVEIIRLEGDKAWVLEVVDYEGNSHVWEEQFLSDAEALGTAIQAIETEGAVAFMRGNNIIPFRQP